MRIAVIPVAMMLCVGPWSARAENKPATGSGTASSTDTKITPLHDVNVPLSTLNKLSAEQIMSDLHALSPDEVSQKLDTMSGPQLKELLGKLSDAQVEDVLDELAPEAFASIASKIINAD